MGFGRIGFILCCSVGSLRILRARRVRGFRRGRLQGECNLRPRQDTALHPPPPLEGRQPTFKFKM